MARIKQIHNKLNKDKFKCLKCRKEKASTSFYVNASPLFSSEKLEICKECINQFIGEKDSSKYLSRVNQVLALLNKPFLMDLWIQRGEDWAKYIPQLSTLQQYKGLTFSDSDFSFEGSLHNTEEKLITDSNEEIIYDQSELNELINFWGRGLSNEEYEFLTNEYQRLLNSYECDSYAMELLFQEVAQIRLTIKKKREKSESVDKELKALQDLLGSANIKPVQETGANATEQATFGTLIKKYENERPIPEPDPMWKDVDGIVKYINVWFLGHLCKMIGIKNEYSMAYEEEMKKYKVEAPKFEEDDSDEGVV